MDNCRQNLDKSSISPSASSSSESATGQNQNQAQEDDDDEDMEDPNHNANDKTLLSSTSSPQLDSHNNYNRSRLMVVPYQPDLRIIRHVMNMSPSSLLSYLFSLETRLCTIRQERKALESENAKLRTFFKIQYNLRSNPNITVATTNNNNDNGKMSEKTTKITSTSTSEAQTEIHYQEQTEDRRIPTRTSTREIETMTDTEDLSQNNISNRTTSSVEKSEDRKESFVSVLAPPLKMKESKKSLGKSRHHSHSHSHSHRSSSSMIPNIRASAIVPSHALPEPLQEAQNLIRTIRSPTFFPEDTSTAVLRNNNDNDNDYNNDNNGGNIEEDQEEAHTSNVHSISISNTNLRSVSNPEIHSSLSSQNLSVNAQLQSEVSTISTTLVAPTITASTTTATIVPTHQSDSKEDNSSSSIQNRNENGNSAGTSENPGSKNEPKQKRREFQERIQHLIRKSSAILCQNQIPTHNEEDTDDHTSAAASSSIFGPLSITGVCSTIGAQSSSSWSDYTDFSRNRMRRRRRQNNLDHDHDNYNNNNNNDSSSSSSQLHIPGFENFPSFDPQERPHSLSSIRTQLQFNVQLLQVHRRQQAAGNLIEELEEENEQGNEHDDLEINSDPDPDPDEEILRPLLGTRNLSNANAQSTNRSQIQSNDSLHVNVDSISSSSSSTEEGRDRGDAGASSPSSSDSESQSDSDPSSVHSLFHPSETQSTTLCGKYGNLTAYSRPRPASGHRYVISELLSRKNESKLPSWVPSYAQKIECILTRYLDEAQANLNTVKNSSNNNNNDDEELQVASGSKSTSRKSTIKITSSQQQQQQEEQKIDEDEDGQKNNNKTESGSGTGIPLDLVYVRLNRSPPPLTLLEFDESSEESCIRSISSTKRRKSCLRISRDAKSFGESRPKNLSFSQHVYIADDADDSKTRSCPGIYYMGEFSISAGVPHLHAAELKRIGILKRRRYKRVRKMVMKVFHCFRCSSNSNLLQASHIFIPNHGKKKILSASQSTTHIPILVDALSSHCQCPQSNFNVSVSKKASSIIRPHRKKSNPSHVKKSKSSNNNHCNEHDRKS